MKLDKYIIKPNTVVAENNEYIRTTNGEVFKVKDAPVHEDRKLLTTKGPKKVKSGMGGIVIDNVESVVSATHENRNSKAKGYTAVDESIKFKPSEAVDMAKFLKLSISKPVKGISPSKLIDLLSTSRRNLATKYRDITKEQGNLKRFNTIKANKSVLKTLPKIEDIYNVVLEAQEYKKNLHLDDLVAQTGNKKAKAIYNRVRPSDYTDVNNYLRLLNTDENFVRSEWDDARSEEAFKQYLGLNDKPKYITKSGHALDNKRTFYKVDPQLESDIFNSYKDVVKYGENMKGTEFRVKSEFPEGTPRTSDGYVKLVERDENMLLGRPMKSRARMLGNFVVSKGKDTNGDYLTYSDDYDFGAVGQKVLGGTPYPIYNKLYYKDQLKKQQGGIKTKLLQQPYLAGSKPVIGTTAKIAVEVLDGRTISLDDLFYPDSVVVNNNKAKTFYSGKLKKYIK